MWRSAICAVDRRRHGADGQEWSTILKLLRDRDLESLKRKFPNYAHPHLLRALDAAVAMARLEEPEAAQRYLELSVFREQTAVPEAAVVRFWSRDITLSEARAAVFLPILERRNLLRLNPTPAGRAITLHTLQFDYIRRTTPDSAGLHSQLVDAYCGRVGAPWLAGPDDGYYFQNLAYHLSAAQRFDDLRSLINQDWMQARLAYTSSASPQDLSRTGLAGFVQDVDIAWKAEVAQGSVQTADLARLYAARLLAHETASAYDESYLEALVALGRDVEAVAFAKYQYDAEARFRSLLNVYRRIAERANSASATTAVREARGNLFPVVRDLGQFAHEIESNDKRAIAFGALGVALLKADPKTGNRYLRTAEELLDRVRDGRMHGFLGLAALLADAGDTRAGQFIHRAVLAAGNDRHMLQIVAEALSHPGLADEIAWFVDLVCHLDVSDFDKGYVIGWACNGLISLRRFDQAEAVIATITDGREWVQAAVNLAKAVVGTDAPRARRILHEAAGMVVSAGNGMQKADQFGEIAAALAGLGDTAADDLFAAGEKAARDPQMHPYNQKLALSKLAVRLVDGGRFEQAQEIAVSIEDPNIRLQMDSFLVDSYAAAGRYDEAVKTAGSIPQVAQRDSALSSVASALAAKRDFDRAEKVIDSMGEVLSTKARAIGDLARALVVDGQVDRAIGMAQRMPRGTTQAELLAFLAATLGKTCDPRAAKLLMEAAAATHDVQMQKAGSERDDAAAALSAALVQLKQLRVAEQVARRIGSDLSKALALVTVAAKLKAHAPKRAAMLFDEAEELSKNAPVSARRRQFLHDISVISSKNLVERNLRKVESYRSETLATQLLDAGEYQRVGKLAEDIYEDHRKADLLNRLAGVLAKAKDRNATRAIATARKAAGASEYRPAELLTELATLLVPIRPKLAYAIFHDADEIPADPDRRVKMVCDFAAACAPRDRTRARDLSDRAWTIARKAPEEDRADLLVRVAGAFDRLARHDRADKIISGLKDADKQAAGWAAAAAVRAEIGSLTQAEEAAQRILGEYPAQRARALTSIAAAFAAANDSRAREIFAEAAKIAGRISDAERRSYALQDVVAGLTRAGRLHDAAETAVGIPAGTAKSDALSELAAAYAADGDLKEAFVTLAMRTIESVPEYQRRPLDDFVKVIAGWTSHLERANRGLALTTVREVTDVAGWLRPDWLMIHKLFLPSQRAGTAT
jgi:hypothetical protein